MEQSVEAERGVVHQSTLIRRTPTREDKETKELKDEELQRQFSPTEVRRIQELDEVTEDDDTEPPRLDRMEEPIPHDVPELSQATESFIAEYMYECHKCLTACCRRNASPCMADVCESRLCLKTTTMLVTFIAACLLVWLYASHRVN